MGKAIVSKLLSREGVARVTGPVARAFLRAGFTADSVTIIGQAGRQQMMIARPRLLFDHASGAEV